MIAWIKWILELLGVYRAGESSQAAKDKTASEEAALAEEAARRKSDAKVDASDDAANLEWLRQHPTSDSKP